MLQQRPFASDSPRTKSSGFVDDTRVVSEHEDGVDVDVKVIVKHTFIEVVDPRLKKMRRSQSDSWLFPGSVCKLAWGYQVSHRDARRDVKEGKHQVLNDDSTEDELEDLSDASTNDLDVCSCDASHGGDMMLSNDVVVDSFMCPYLQSQYPEMEVPEYSEYAWDVPLLSEWVPMGYEGDSMMCAPMRPMSPMLVASQVSSGLYNPMEWVQQTVGSSHYQPANTEQTADWADIIVASCVGIALGATEGSVIRATKSSRTVELSLDDCALSLRSLFEKDRMCADDLAPERVSLTQPLSSKLSPSASSFIPTNATAFDAPKVESVDCLPCTEQHANHVHGKRRPNRRSAQLKIATHLRHVEGKCSDCVFLTYKINRLGFGSADILREHYEQYGPVDEVLLSNEQEKSEEANHAARIRPAGIAIIVMHRPEDAAAALAVGETQEVLGVCIRVRKFERRSFKQVSSDDHLEGPEMQEDDNPEAANVQWSLDSDCTSALCFKDL